MTLKSAIFSTTALVILGTGASADVTAQEIWTDWKDYMSNFGYDVDATEAMSGDTLTISNLAMTFPMPEAEGDVSMTIEKVEFVETGDGRVRMIFPTVMPINLKVGSDGTDVDAVIEYTMNNMDMVASGDPSKVTYTYTADAIGMALGKLVVDGEAMGDNVIKASISASDLKGVSVMEPGDLRTVDQTMTLGNTTYTVDFKDPESDDNVKLDGMMDSMSFNGTTMIPKSMDPENMAVAMEQGFAVNGSFGYTGSATQFAFTDGSGTTSGDSAAAAAEVSIEMDKSALSYAGSSSDVRFNIGGGQIPLPVTLELGKMGFNLLMPIAKSDEPSDFALGLTFADFVTSDMLWSMIDPGAVLPRDPATISLDLTGKAKMLFDLFDPEQMTAVENGEAMPAELEALKLNNLLVSVAGAKLTGTGDFTFDNTDMETFDGIPKPTGGVDLQLDGGNGLMDKLVEMGLLPQEQAMGARMMMGLFARPGPGDDSLTSAIEINEEGHIIANGQRIQ